MLVNFNCINKLGKDSGNETCVFAGINYNDDVGICIISVDNSSYEYVLPMNRQNYDSFAEDFYVKLSKSLMNKRKMIVILGSPVIKIKRGVYEDNYNYDKYEYNEYKVELDDAEKTAV